MSNICGHCGEEVKDGFSVCQGCGANYRYNSLGAAFIGIVMGLSSFFVFEYSILGGFAVLFVSGCIVFTGTRKAWYRYNA